MKKGPLYKKITATTNRLRDDDEFDEDEALRDAIKQKDTFWMENLKNITLYPIP